MSDSGEGFAARRGRYLAALGDEAALIFGSPEALRNGDSEYRYRPGSDLWYLTGWEEPDAAALFRPGAAQPFVLFVRPRDPEREVWTGRRAGVEGARARYGADAAFDIAELGARLGGLLQGWGTLHYRVGTHDDVVLAAVRRAERVAGRNGLEVPWRLVEPSRALAALRLVKDADELARMRRATALSVEAHLAAMAMGRAGVHEYEIEAEIERIFRRGGGTGAGYTTIVGAGRNATVLHYVENRDALVDGQLCLVDAGCEYGWYTADLTRTWPVSGRYTGPQRALYEVVLAAHDAAVAAARPGARFRDLEDAAVRVLTGGLVALGFLRGDVDTLVHEAAYRRWYMHSIGHWLGLDVHDAGAYHVGPRSRELAAGMVLTVEPGLYVADDDPQAPEAFRGVGVRIEDDLLVHEHGAELLSAALPRTIPDVEAACSG